MSTVLRDPQTAGPAPEEGPGLISTLPAGGSPDQDRAFLRWVDGKAQALNARALDRLHRHRVDVLADPIRSYQLMNHLYKHLCGIVFPSGQGPTYSHKVRFLAVQYRLRPEELAREVDEYAGRLVEGMLPS